jgi:hypothetical protein
MRLTRWHDDAGFAHARARSEMELHIPWIMVGYADPSAHKVYDFEGSSINLTIKFPVEPMSLYVEPVLLSAIHPLYQSSVFLAEAGDGGASGIGAGQQLLGNISRTLYESPRAFSYWWDDWTVGCYCERYKQSAAPLASFFRAVHQVPLGSKVIWNASDAPPFSLHTQFCECLTGCTAATLDAYGRARAGRGC